MIRLLTLSHSLHELARRLLSEGPHKLLPTPRRIRIRFNDVFIVDTASAVYVWEHEYYPQFYIPLKALKHWETKQKLEGGQASILTVKVGNRETDRVLAFTDGEFGGKTSKLAGLVRVEIGAVGRVARSLSKSTFRSFISTWESLVYQHLTPSTDQYYEEDTPIYVHPRDPFKRIDILHSTRPVKISVGGAFLAATTTSQHLYETLLPCRYYIPPTSIGDWSLLKPSTTRTQCPYKGEAEYYDVVLPDGNEYKDFVWYYRRPLLECTPVTGFLCFYNEKVDIELDGVTQERPKTKFS